MDQSNVLTPYTPGRIDVSHGPIVHESGGDVAVVIHFLPPTMQERSAVAFALTTNQAAELSALLVDQFKKAIAHKAGECPVCHKDAKR